MYILNVTIGLSGSLDKGESLAGCLEEFMNLERGSLWQLSWLTYQLCLTLGVGPVCEL